MKYKFTIFATCLALILLSACSDNSNQAEKKKPMGASAKIAAKGAETVHKIKLKLTAEEQAYIDQKREAGGLTVATRIRDDLYNPNIDGKSGFHYRLVQNFTDSLNIPLKVKVVKFKDYFSTGGDIPPEVKIDAEFKYIPDLIKEVDLITDTITILPWREKLLRFIPVTPNRQLLVSKKGEELTRVDQLLGKTIIVSKNTSYYSRFLELEQELNTKFKFIFENEEEVIINKISKNINYVTAIDSGRIIREMRGYEKISACFPITDMESLGWAVHPDNKILQGLLKKYLDQMKSSDKFSRLWESQFKVTLMEYLDLIN